MDSFVGFPIRSPFAPNFCNIFLSKSLACLFENIFLAAAVGNIKIFSFFGRGRKAPCGEIKKGPALWNDFQKFKGPPQRKQTISRKWHKSVWKTSQSRSLLAPNSLCALFLLFVSIFYAVGAVYPLYCNVCLQI